MKKTEVLLVFNSVLCMCVFLTYLEMIAIETGHGMSMGKVARYWDVIPRSCDVGSNAIDDADSKGGLHSCNKTLPNRKFPVAVNLTLPSWDTLFTITRRLQAGGRFKPNCTGPDRVAIIVPYRGRDNQLRMLLHNLHPFLQRQPIQYGLYIIELVPNATFNKAMLMNIGFVEASKRDDYQCFIFHDVDLLPEDNAILYTCPTMPRHMSVAVSKYNYSLPYGTLFGGVVAITKEHFEKVNGYSNLFYGWGGEDDEMVVRLRNASLKMNRYPIEIARYKMIEHKRDKDNAANPQRVKLIRTTQQRLGKDGLNALSMRNYTVVYVDDKTTLYTRIIVSFTTADYGLK